MFAALPIVNEPSAATSAIGKPDVREIGHVLEAGVREVAAGDLRAALEQVPGDRAATERRPVVLGPAVMGHRRPDRERRVGDAAGHDDLRAGAQRVGDRLRALVHVRAHEIAPATGKVLGEERPPAFVREVVAFDDADAQAPQPQLPRERLQAPRRGARVRRAEIADDRDAVLDASREDRTDEAVELRLVAPLGVLPPGDLRECERALGKRLENQRRRAAARDEGLDHRAGGVGAVAREPRAPADRQCLARHCGSSPQWTGL